MPQAAHAYTVAIHPDDYTPADEPPLEDSASSRWAQYLEAAGHTVRWVDVRRADILDQLQGCDAFMWRWAHFDGMGRIARRLLPVVEQELGLVVYPDWHTCWHYDDKIAQAFLFKAAGIPTPKTWVWFDRAAALAWAQDAPYPLVLKLASGAGSSNVHLVRTADEARAWIHYLFTHRVLSLGDGPRPGGSLPQRAKDAARLLLRGSIPALRDNGRESQTGYVLFQQFLPGNPYDTRVNIIGNRAWGRRRYNRPNDFRASGSNLLDRDPSGIDLGFVRLAFRAAQTLSMQSCSIDGLYDGDRHTLCEISYTTPCWGQHRCPGHWVLEGDPDAGTLRWVEGHMWGEEAQIEDLLAALEQRRAG